MSVLPWPKTPIKRVTPWRSSPRTTISERVRSIRRDSAPEAMAGSRPPAAAMAPARRIRRAACGQDDSDGGVALMFLAPGNGNAKSVQPSSKRQRWFKGT